MLRRLASYSSICLLMLFMTGVALSQRVQFNFRSFDVDLPGATGTAALGINPEGDIVGRYFVGAATHSFLLSDGTATNVDPPFGIPGTSQAWGINPL